MNPEQSITARLAQLEEALAAAAVYDLGFPGAVDLPDITNLDLFARVLLNNVGDPYGAGPYRMHTHSLERDVVGTLADWFQAPLDDRAGYVTTGSTESMIWSLLHARTSYPDATVFASTAAHYSVGKATSMLRMPLQQITTDRFGEIRYDILAAAVAEHARRGAGQPAAIVVASIGTTMTEALDNVTRIHAALDEAGIPPGRRWIHSDAALAGVPLAVTDQLTPAPAFDFAAGATTLAVSGHKFLAAPTPCGVVMARASALTASASISYTGSLDSTITGSRSGHTPLLLWYLLQMWGRNGLRARAEHARNLAQYTVDQLTAAGIPAWRNPHAFTVVLPRPSQQFLNQWPIAVDGDQAHIITMPGRDKDTLDRFITDLTAATVSRTSTPQEAVA